MGREFPECSVEILDRQGEEFRTLRMAARPQPTQLEQTPASRRFSIPRQVEPKKQYRIAFAEPCATLGSLKTLGQVIDVLAQSLTALRLLYFAGWVHSDVSPDNVMAYSTTPTQWHVNLRDLEHTKEYSSILSGPHKSQNAGTPYFMPNEILFGGPLLPSSLADDDSDSIDDPENEDVSPFLPSNEGTGAEARPDKPPPAVIPNFQHDLESIWWLTVHSVTARVDHPPSKEFAQTIFRRATELRSYSRAVFLEQEIEYRLRECLHPDVVSIATCLDRMRKNLMRYYHKRNLNRLTGNTAEDTKCFSKIHAVFFLAFKAMKLLGDKVLNMPLITEEGNVDDAIPPL